jgi:hypothetical protein
MSTTIPEAATVKTITVELRAQDWDLLKSEHERLSRDANPALVWNRFLHGCLAIGLDRLQRIPALEALERIAALEG